MGHQHGSSTKADTSVILYEKERGESKKARKEGGIRDVNSLAHRPSCLFPLQVFAHNHHELWHGMCWTAQTPCIDALAQLQPAKVRVFF
jgi:hypothetical protein